MNVLGRRLDFDARNLILFGCIYVMIGLAIIPYHPVMVDLFHTHLPVWVRVAIWAGSGAVAIVGAFVGGKASIVGWALLWLGPAQRAVSYAWGIVLQSTGPQPINWAFLALFFLYLLLTLIVIHLARGDEDAVTPAIILRPLSPEDIDEKGEA